MIVRARPKFVALPLSLDEMSRRSENEPILVPTGQRRNLRILRASFEDMEITEPRSEVDTGSGLALKCGRAHASLGPGNGSAAARCGLSEEIGRAHV